MKKNNTKTVTLATVLMLLLTVPFSALAQTSQGGLFNTDFYNDQTERQGMLQNRDAVITWTLTNQTFGQDAPLGSGIAILLVFFFFFCFYKIFFFTLFS